MPIATLLRPERRRVIVIVVCVHLAAAAWAVLPTAAADHDALWKIVHGQCVPDEMRHHDPGPCTRVYIAGGTARGYAVLKDRNGATQFLVIPTARVTGIESRALVAPHAPNYWAPAWEARRYVFLRAKRPLPRDAISLAVNSMRGRSQNQLHIHVDCVRPDVRDYLAAHSAELPTQWSHRTVRFDGHRYWAMRLGGADLRGVDLFGLLARHIAAARADMGDWTLVAVGIAPTGFAVLAGHVDPASSDRASGEELQDHGCALAARLSAAADIHGGD
jgi:CDP-diacylglycerol pyrophosphatase